MARVYDILPAGEKQAARVVTAERGRGRHARPVRAGAGLPRSHVLSADRSYADWWPHHEPTGTVIFVGYTRQALEPYCDAMGPIAILGNDRNIRNEAFESTISVCNVMKVTSSALGGPVPVELSREYDDPSDSAVAWRAMTARGILSYGAYLPYRRLDRAEIRAVAGTGGGKGTRTVASYDEDSTTLGVAACQALAAAPGGVRPGALWFATVSPAYLDKTNATAIHAALRLPDDAAVFDAVGAVRSALGALRAGLAGPGPALVVAADIRTGRPGSPDEAEGGDAGAALLVGSDADGPLVAEVLGTASATEEFLDRWRVPGESHSRRWEERFGEGRYAALGARAWDDGLKAAGVLPEQVDRVVIAAAHGRPPPRWPAAWGWAIAWCPASMPPWASPAQPIPVCCWPTRSTAPQRAKSSCWWCWPTGPTSWCCGRPMPWPRPARPSAWPTRWRRAPRCPTARRWPGGAAPAGRAAAPARAGLALGVRRARSAAWKFGLVGTDERPLADIRGTIVTYTVDRLAYSPSPPVVFAVVDFDGGGRLPVELTDVDAADVAIGGRVEMTFRRLFTADGIHNYFWKARPVREGLREGSA